ncbi:MAG TPA: hypothetical protein VMA83_06005 [Solirubrobacteraceae bacterium]|nr:hypothetical protein [Solirubrobacteraceae bacterium]
MDQQERNRVGAWFKEHWKHGECPVCHSNDWRANEIINGLYELETMQSRTPILFVYCNVCGYSLPINAVIAGIRQPRDFSDAEPKGATGGEPL